MRTDSIYAKLQVADKKGGTTYFLDLMIFLEETSGDKFGKAADLVKEWGFKTSKTSLCDGYISAQSSWLFGRAHAFSQAVQQGSTLDAETRQMIGHRSFQIMSNPSTDPELVLGFAKLEAQREKTKMARDKFEFSATAAALKHLDKLRAIRNDKSLDQDARLLKARQQLFGELPKE